MSFGLVTIPVALYTATESKTPKFKMLRGSDHSAVKYKRVAEADGEEVAWDEIVRGYEVEKGKYVVFTDDELEAASATDGSRLVDVVQFVDESEIAPQVLAREARGGGTEVLRLEGLCALPRPVPAEQAAGEHAVAVTPIPSSRQVGRIVSSIPRESSEYSIWTSQIGCTACARRIVSAPTSERPIWRT